MVVASVAQCGYPVMGMSGKFIFLCPFEKGFHDFPVGECSPFILIGQNRNGDFFGDMVRVDLVRVDLVICAGLRALDS